jgi:two-component system C4-dicarboxylate transport sensor histidine kinase DctB
MESDGDPSAHPVHPRWGWLVVAALALGAAVLTGWFDDYRRSQQRLGLLETEAQRTGLEIMSTTLNGNLMGSITMLGLMDHDIKQEATDGLRSDDADVPARLSILGRAFSAEGVFVVGRDGIVRSSWDRINKPSTGLDVRFRPYYQKAMDGKTSVYAAVSMARGDRSLYFAAPIFAETASSSSGAGAVVARTSLDKVDALLNSRFDTTVLLSPQGVVFASNHADWVGRIEGQASPQRLQEIRRLKQFGALFEEQDPLALPVQNHNGLQRVEGRLFAVAQSTVNWNDPSGIWTLLVMEDLSRTVPWPSIAWKAFIGGLAAAVLGSMGLHLLRGQRAQALAAKQLQQYADEQKRHAENRRALAALSTSLQRCKDLDSFATTFFQGARTIADVTQGALYSATDETGHTLALSGSSACAVPPPATIHAGEGLVGQVALERRSLLVPLTGDNNIWTLRSGVGGSTMAALLMVPLLVQERLVGVVEMAFMQTPDVRQRDVLDELMAVLANHLEILRRTLHLEWQATHHTDEIEDIA